MNGNLHVSTLKQQTKNNIGGKKLAYISWEPNPEPQSRYQHFLCKKRSNFELKQTNAN